MFFKEKEKGYHYSLENLFHHKEEKKTSDKIFKIGQVVLMVLIGQLLLLTTPLNELNNLAHKHSAAEESNRIHLVNYTKNLNNGNYKEASHEFYYLASQKTLSTDLLINTNAVLYQRDEIDYPQEYKNETKKIALNLANNGYETQKADVKNLSKGCVSIDLVCKWIMHTGENEIIAVMDQEKEVLDKVRKKLK
jgi:hypothetical protein